MFGASASKALRVLGASFLLMGLAGGVALAGKDPAAFDAARSVLKTPAQQGITALEYGLHPGESAYVPEVAPEITPFDEPEAVVYPPVQGNFESSDDTILTVNDRGLMTAKAPGVVRVTYQKPEAEAHYRVTVSDEIPTERAKAMAYVARREFLETRQARLPKYNKYAKWYYGKKKEVGWCAVFAIWCANASGSDPLKEKDSANVPEDATLYLKEGQVGNQYDGFAALGRFGAIPRTGYMVIYADMRNGYRVTHIGIVVDAVPLEGGMYRVTTVEGNMSNSVKSYVYLYDSGKDNHLVGVEKGLKLQRNMSKVPEDDREDPLPQYEPHTDHWTVFGFCETWI
ncbi:MAG: CHAP domain-containing protein [Clostridia bacterium]|nr:CHAP domain-containing protein [Clostridia bacterium]